MLLDEHAGLTWFRKSLLVATEELRQRAALGQASHVKDPEAVAAVFFVLSTAPLAAAGHRGQTAAGLRAVRTGSPNTPETVAGAPSGRRPGGPPR